MSVNLLIVPRSKNLKKINCDTEPKASVQAIIDAYADVNKVNPNRVKLSYQVDSDDSATKKPVRHVLKNYKTLEENGLDFSTKKTLTVSAKDVGPQIGWSTVFMVEYLGPIVIQSLFYFGFYDPTYNTWTQKVAYWMTLLHYLKRIYETLFVHVFSADTMPVKYLFRNCGHYWVFSGVGIGYCVYAPQNEYYKGYKEWLFHVDDRANEQLAACGIVWLILEACNYYCHIILRRLRADGSREHRIPYGFFFELVSFPNYFFESLGWLVFALMVNNWSAYVFYVVGTATMMTWAAQKHRRYKKEFGDKYPKQRKAMIPYIF